MRSLSLDLFKCLFALMVIGIHTGIFSESSKLLSYVFCNGLFRLAVPLFFVINGYFFFGAVQNGNVWRWVQKITVLYVVWMVVYLHYWVDLGNLTPLLLLKNLHTVLFGYFHLWYLPAVIGAASLVLLTKTVSPKIQIVFAGVLFSLGVAIQYIGNLHLLDSNLDKLINMGWLYRNFLFMGFPFFVIGYLIKKESIALQTSDGVIGLLAFVGLTILLLEAYINFILNGESFDFLVSLFIVVPVIFISILKIKIDGNIPWLGSVANGIFFSHPLLVFLLADYKLSGTSLFVVVSVLAVLISLMLTLANRKIKILL